MEAAKHLHRRDLRDLQAQHEKHSIAAAHPGPRIDPLDTAALERFMLEGTGITKARPAVPSGKSGDDFLRVIPFQILSWVPR